MTRTKEKQTVDLLDLPKKERVRLCREIRHILKQRVSEERELQEKTEPEIEEPYIGEELLKPDSYLAKTHDSHFWNKIF